MNEIEKKSETGLTRIQNLIKGAVVHSENRILHTRLRGVEIGLAVVVLLAGGVIFWLAGEAKREHRRTTSELTWVQDGFKLQDLGPAERKEKYRKFCLQIFAEYSFRYDKREVRCFSKEQKLAVINKNFELAELLNFGYYDVFCFGTLETSLNPHAKGRHGEWGWLQQKEGTARFAERMLQLMPDRFRQELAFRITDPEDLLDPMTALKVAYVLMYTFRRDFRGREEWWVSIYHWGGFLSRYWRNGKGEIPVKFHINDIEYDVYSYYFSWKTLKETFESGQIRAGKPVVIKYAKARQRLLDEEVRLHKAQRIVRSLRTKVEERDSTLKSLNHQNKILARDLRKAEHDLRYIYNVAKRGRMAELRKNLRKARGTVKELLKKIEKDDMRQFIAILVGAVLILLLVIFEFGYGVHRSVVNIIAWTKKWRKK